VDGGSAIMDDISASWMKNVRFGHSKNT
jgi:hypothetical protein